MRGSIGAARALRLVLAVLALGLAPLALPQQAPARAEAVQGAADPGALLRELRLTELFPVLAEEGKAYGASLGQSMFPGRDGVRWQQTVARIYDPHRMEARFDEAFAAALAGKPGAIEAARGFFGSAAGQRIVTLEIEARRVLLDEAAREAAEVAADKLRDARSPRLRLIRDLIEAGDLIETNVAAGLTGAAAFDEGLTETLPAAQRLPENERMAQVWRQEGEIRATTTAWLLTYMALAYAPLSDGELQAYIDFSATPEGREINAALFAGFDAAFTPVMRELGHETGRAMQGSEI